MGIIFDSIKQRFRQKDILIQLIVINVVIFVGLGVVNVIGTLFKLNSFSIVEYLGLSSSLEIVVLRAWTLISYMFVHEGFFHLFFNMLILFGFGQIFLSHFNARNLGSLYILGGLSGAVLYIIAFNTIPFYVDLGSSLLIGASASVMAIIFAAAFYRPNAEVRLFFLGSIKIIYIAIFIFVLDFISLADKSNPGGHVAHIGGAVLGYIYAKQYLKGRDITAWLSHIMDFLANLFSKKAKRKPKMKVKYTKRDTDYQYNQQKNNSIGDIDSILDKIKSSGYSSLSQDEKKRLFDASKR